MDEPPTSLLTFLRKELAAEIGHESDRAKYMIARMITEEKRKNATVVRVRVDDVDDVVIATEVLTGRVVTTMDGTEARMRARVTIPDWFDGEHAMCVMAAESLPENDHIFYGEPLEDDWFNVMDPDQVREASELYDLIELVARFFATTDPRPDPEFAAFLGMPVNDVFIAHAYSSWLNGNTQDMACVVPIVRSELESGEYAPVMKEVNEPF